MSIMRVTLSGIFVGQGCQNVLHFENPDGALNHEAIRNDIANFFLVSLRNLQNIGYVWTQIKVQTVSPATDVATVWPISSPGVFSGDGAHVSLAALFSIRTNTPGRQGHGRFYMAGVHVTSVINSVMPAATQTSYATRAGEIVARYKSGGTGPITLGVCPRLTPSDFKAMVAIVVRPVLGIQRRRNIGVGG